ncbi:MAG: M6 family metalloprotease domain-containing protein [Candidatus Zixiibacteriota bacterium]|nr:MAG: M6 family metalloprotease domain-containing protein [candidate division Zixibacteria bacterium]
MMKYNGERSGKMENFGICRILGTLLTLLLFLSASASAVTLTPEVWEKLKADGKLDSYIQAMQDARERGVDTPQRRQTSRSLAAGFDDETVDTVRVLVLLVDFIDNPYTGGPVAAIPENFDSVLFSTGGFNPTGSMTEFFLENSYGKFFIIGDVYGWFRMPQTYAYYVGIDHGKGPYPWNSQGLTVDAVAAADPTVDFSLYDYSGPDGYPDDNVDGLFVVHAGPGYEESGNDDQIHSHMWILGPNQVVKDGVIINRYTCVPEESFSSQSISPIGVFCHEYGHFLGLPDLYDVADTTWTSLGLGKWSLMASGNYNGGSLRPAHLDAWCKIALGFAVPTEIGANMLEVEIPQVESVPTIYKLWSDGDYSGTEYFLIENRQQVGFDNALPGRGLLIYHVDDLAGDEFGNNNDPAHYHVALEQADGLFQLEYAQNNAGDGADPFPGLLQKTSFDDKTTPNTRGYGDVTTRTAVWNISVPGSLMTANLDVTWSRPYFTFLSMQFVDENLNDVFEAGETIKFFFELRNDWLEASDAVVTLTCNDSAIEFLTPSVTFSTLPGEGFVADNNSLPIVFTVPDTITPRFDSFFVTITSDGDANQLTHGMEMIIGRPQVLIVDADRDGSYEDLYADDLYRQRIPAVVWDRAVKGTPSTDTLSSYNIVVWFTGDTASNVITPPDVAAIEGYLNNNGNLFLSGQTIAAELHAEDSAFLENYLHARYDGLYFALIHTGFEGSPVGDGLTIRYLGYGNQDYLQSAQIQPVGGAVPTFSFLGGGYSSLSFSGGYKLVYFNFPYEAVSNSYAAYDKRDAVLTRILRFFNGFTTEVYDGSEFTPIPKSFTLGQNYPNPFNPRTTIEYALQNTGHRTIPRTRLMVLNILGQHIRTLVDQVQSPGRYTAEWDGTDDSGRKIASGVYFYRLQRGPEVESKKMIFLK